MVKKGDTLVEVLLAVGIFSMIAISVVAVMSGGTSEAQLALETTLAREEIDAQAEALRYIHDSYINDKNATNENGEKNENLPTIALWQAITRSAITLEEGDNSASNKRIVEYAPDTCSNILDVDQKIRNNAFILNTRRLNQGNAVAFVKANQGSSSIFFPASTYPRLVFGDTNADLTAQGTENINVRTSNPAGNVLNRVEGIYIIAVADRGTTEVYDYNGQNYNTSPAFYDFYIRTCWYGTDAETPSTISTVIRLHNPDVTTTAQLINISEGGGNYIPSIGDKGTPVPPSNTWPKNHEQGWTFDGFCLIRVEDINNPPDSGDLIDEECPGTRIGANEAFIVTDPKYAGSSYVKKRMFTHTKYTIYYDSNGSSWQRDPQICYEDENSNCVVQTDDIKRSGYEFLGWCTGNVDSKDGICNGTTYRKNSVVPIPSGFNSSRQLRLKAIWRERNETITIKATWNAGRNNGSSSYPDFDSYIAGKTYEGAPFTASYGNLEPSETVSGVKRTLAKLDHDCISDCGNETFTINTLGGRDYYYYILNRSGWFRSNNNLTVVVSGPYLGTKVFYSNAASGSNGGTDSGRYWNVFAYKDGEIVIKNTITNSPDISY